MPQSPVVALLNNVKAPAGGDIGVVAGDISGGNWLKKFGVFASDHIIYEARDNDLVVNTDAMFHGARRSVVGYVFDQGADVSHFSYFSNVRTRTALVDWLSEKPGNRPDTFRRIPQRRSNRCPCRGDRRCGTAWIDRSCSLCLTSWARI